MNTGQINFQKGNGLLPAIIQETKSGEVLMLGFMNKDAYDKTRTSGYVHFFSRTKKRLWMKGETSGNTLKVDKLFLDCDADTILVMATLNGSAVCHTGNKSCFFEEVL